MKDLLSRLFRSLPAFAWFLIGLSGAVAYGASKLLSALDAAQSSGIVQ